jgi:two-component system cell cycle sensor histidine kinase/response regulator CckA
MIATSMARENCRTALVVEDEPIVMDLVTNILIRNGYNIVPAVDGDQAAKLFHQHAGELCLLLVNISLPKTSGLEFIDELPTRIPRIPVIFITGLGEQQQLVKQAMDEGFPVMQKPFTAEALMSFVVNATSQQRAVQTDPES